MVKNKELVHREKQIVRIKIIIFAVLLLIVAGLAGSYLLYQETKDPEPINPYRGGIVIGSSERALEIAESMTLEEKVGQLFITPFLNDGEDLNRLVNHHLGGFIYTGEFFGTTNPKDASIIFRDMKDAAEIKPFQAVAEEGGNFVAVSKWPLFRGTTYKLPRLLFEEGGMEAVVAQEEEKLLFLKGMGLNMNFGPITNIATSAAVGIYDQTLGQDKEITSEYIRQLTLLYDDVGMSAVLRYYTGENTEAFMMGCYMGAPAIMMSNGIVSGSQSVDNSRPISLSRPWHDYLRKELGFEGVIIISDLLNPVFDEYSQGQAKSVTALQAGNNMIWATNYESERLAVLEAVNNGALNIEDIEESVVRVLTWKIRYGLIQ